MRKIYHYDYEIVHGILYLVFDVFTK